MRLERNHVELAWLATDRVSPERWPALRAMLDDAERLRADRFRVSADRDSYVAAHALVRGMLALAGGQHPTGWRFAVDALGKPEVVLAPGQPAIRINLSHARGLVTVVATLDHDIGCDVEALSDAVPQEVIPSFAPAERAGLAALDGTAASVRFHELWTLKEAYLKAVGGGLDIGLDAACFRFDPLSVSVSFAADRLDCPEDWHFELHHPTPTHVLSLAVQHPSPKVSVGPVDLDRLVATLNYPP